MPEQYYQQVLESLQRCALACSRCAMECLQEEDVARQRECILLCWDCSDICRAVQPFLVRGSQFGKELISLCATICNRCATECHKHDAMEHCRVCGEICDDCATACNGFANS